MQGNTLTLFSLFQKLDYRDKDNAGFKKLIGIITAYLFSNTILSFSFSLVYDERSFIIMSLTSNLFLLSMIVINDFNNLFLATAGIYIIRVLPVKDSEVFSAKFISAAVFLLLFIIAASLPQILFFYFIYENVLHSIYFLLTNIIFCYLAIGSIALIYSLIILYFKKGSTIFLNAFQFLFFIFVFYSTSAGSRSRSIDLNLIQKQDLLKHSFFKFLPQTYFSGAVYEPWVLLILFSSCAAVVLLLYRFISVKYNILLDNASSLKSKKTGSFKFPGFTKINLLISRIIPGGNTESATYGLVRDHILSSRYLRLKYFPLLIIPVIIVLIGLFSKSRDLLFFNVSDSKTVFFNTPIILISPSITLTIFLCARMLISNTKILDEKSTDTKWIFDSLPVKNISSYIKGADSFIYFSMILPMLIFTFILISFKADLLTLSLNFLFISTSVYFIISVASLFDKTIPFTLENSKFNSATKFLEVILSMILGAAVFLIQIFVFQSIIFVLSAAALFIAVSYLLNRN